MHDYLNHENFILWVFYMKINIFTSNEKPERCTVKPRNSGLLYHPKFFHYYGVFHCFDGTFSRKGHFDHPDDVHYFAGFHYFAVHYCGVLL